MIHIWWDYREVFGGDDDDDDDELYVKHGGLLGTLHYALSQLEEEKILLYIYRYLL